MLAKSCPKCGTEVEYGADRQGQRVACMNCRTLFNLEEDQEILKAQQDQALRAREARIAEELRWRRYVKIGAMVAGCGALIALIAFAVLWIVEINSWEYENKTSVVELSKEAKALRKTNKRKALDAYAKLNDLVGERQLENPALRKILSDARIDAALLEQEIAEEEFVLMASKLGKDAKARRRQSDHAGAYLAYKQIVDASREKPPKMQQAKELLDEANNEMEVLYQVYGAEIEKALEAQRVKQEEECKRIESERLAEENRKAEEKRKAEEARLEAERKKSEAERIKALQYKYRNASTKAHEALNVLKKLNAKLEVGMYYANYLEDLGEANAEVTIFVDSAEGKEMPEFCDHLRQAIAQYQLAKEAWKADMRNASSVEILELMQSSWNSAKGEIDSAGKLLQGN